MKKSKIFPEGEVKKTLPQEVQVPVRCKRTISLLLSLIFIQNFVSTNSISCSITQQEKERIFNATIAVVWLRDLFCHVQVEGIGLNSSGLKSGT